MEGSDGLHPSPSTMDAAPMQEPPISQTAMHLGCSISICELSTDLCRDSTAIHEWASPAWQALPRRLAAVNFRDGRNFQVQSITSRSIRVIDKFTAREVAKRSACWYLHHVATPPRACERTQVESYSRDNFVNLTGIGSRFMRTSPEARRPMLENPIHVASPVQDRQKEHATGFTMHQLNGHVLGRPHDFGSPVRRRPGRISGPQFGRRLDLVARIDVFSCEISRFSTHPNRFHDCAHCMATWQSRDLDAESTAVADTDGHDA